ncbi:M13 family metallopeptidase [Alteromonas oceanisediminis]|uniref:M13 family metallopeptidase n=1 Tax=Alteromonas oceanisediminis TaxID=2836180 RepID=UPI001BD9FD99|nr:M13-type metalloendopeptidase [Alteromonas oceanisediminis]MBT0586610.1 peptidase M13 [Alteromonas oceanisediminis]
MKRKLSSVGLAVSAALMLSACSPNTPSSQVTGADGVSETQTQPADVQQDLSSGVVKENMDLSVDPGDDFYQYVNGTFLKNFEIPADKASYGVFVKLRDEAQEDVIEIIRESAEGNFEQGTDEQKVGDMYASFMDVDTRNALGLEPLAPMFSQIDAISSYEELATFFGKTARYGVSTPFSFFQYADFKSPEEYGLYVFQSGLGLPDREYYFKDDETSQSVRDKYLAHLETVFTIAGQDDAAEKAQTVYDIEEKIAALHMKKEQTRNWAQNYEGLTLDELKALMPKFAVEKYVAATGFETPKKLIIMQRDFLAGIDDVIAEVSLDDWKTYLDWSVLNSSASYLTTELDEANFNFYNKTLYGVQEQQPMWRRATRVLDNTLGEVIGKVYVKRHFPPAAKARMTELVDNLLLAYEQSIKELDWMTEETRVQALDKLSKFTVKIGYPDKWKDYSALSVDAKDLFGNIKAAADVQHAEQVEKQGKPVDKTEWGMTPQTVNAYYNPPANEIVFPAAILQPPFFDLNAEDAVNYGGIGAVIGHEIGHGFDDSGSAFDGDGVMRNWWTDADLEEFKSRTSQLVEQYNAFEALPDVYVNGEFTLGENIGDLGGISIGLQAYKLSLNGEPAPVLDGFTGVQRVFIGYAQVWAGKYRDEALRSQIDTDPHSPGKFRTNGAVRNVPEWYSAFDVTPEDALYLPPEERVKIW